MSLYKLFVFTEEVMDMYIIIDFEVYLISFLWKWTDSHLSWQFKIESIF